MIINNYIDQGVFTAKNIDLRRKVHYKISQEKLVQESAWLQKDSV